MAEYRKASIEKAFQIYTTDVLKALAESWGCNVEQRFYDAITVNTEEQLTGDEVALQVIERAGLRGKSP